MAPRKKAAWDHPRVCGEQRGPSRYPFRPSGSSPRVRGAVSHAVTPPLHGGIIPARAGSRGQPVFDRVGVRDHPRACGEQSMSVFIPSIKVGSSPRVRGAVAALAVHDAVDGIIPARAGSSQPYSMSCRCLGDHPRVCGEQLMDEIKLKPCPGSSPRARGAVNGAYGARCHVGIIPARAGSSRPIRTSGCAIWGHPRVCGEQSRFRSSAPLRSGSSPRVRGAGRHYPQADQPQGIIPACAGSRFASRPRPSTAGDHPRVCGEQLARVCFSVALTGSSPRVRGAAYEQRCIRAISRIIPACAGSRRGSRACGRPGRDHPRVCGEQDRLLILRIVR